MKFKFWKKYGRIERPADSIKDQSAFDILESELSSMIIVQKQDIVHLTYHAIYGIKLYDIIYRSPVNCLFSIFRSKDKQEAIGKFIHLSQILTVIHKELGLDARNHILNAQTLEKAVQFILKYKYWMPIHFAGKFNCLFKFILFFLISFLN